MSEPQTFGRVDLVAEAIRDDDRLRQDIWDIVADREEILKVFANFDAFQKREERFRNVLTAFLAKPVLPLEKWIRIELESLAEKEHPAATILVDWAGFLEPKRSGTNESPPHGDRSGISFDEACNFVRLRAESDPDLAKQEPQLAFCLWWHECAMAKKRVDDSNVREPWRALAERTFTFIASE